MENSWIMLDDVQLGYADLHTGVQYKGAGKFRTGARLHLSAEQAKVVQAEIEKRAKIKWGEKAAAKLKAAGAKDNVSLRMNDDDGTAVLSANCPGGDTEASCMKPRVFRRDLTPAAPGDLYRSCFVKAKVEIYGDDRYDVGVFAKLVALQFKRDPKPEEVMDGSSGRADEGFEALDAPTTEDFS